MKCLHCGVEACVGIGYMAGDKLLCPLTNFYGHSPGLRGRPVADALRKKKGKPLTPPYNWGRVVQALDVQEPGFSLTGAD